MNGLFWLLLVPAVLTCGLIAWATDRTLCLLQRRYRRAAARREMARMNRELLAALRQNPSFVAAIQVEMEDELIALRRKQLDNAATSQDRYSRRIH
jgi:homoserine kinase